MCRSWSEVVFVLIAVALALALGACGGGGSGKPGLLDPPTTVTAQPANMEVTIDWGIVSGASGYNLYWATTPGVTKATGTLAADVTAPYLHTGLTNGTTYYYVLTSLRGGREGLESIEVSGTPFGTPTGLLATGETSQVSLDWTPEPGALTYNLYWSSSPGVTTATGTQIPGVSPPYLHAPVPNGVPYFYVVTAVNGPVESTESAEVVAMPIDAPTGVAAAATSLTEISTSWSAVAGATSYNIYWANAAGVTKATGTRIAGVTSPYLHTGLTTGVPHFYVVTALNATGTGAESAESVEVSATPGIRGILDVSFGGQGYVVHDGGAGGNGDDVGRAIAVDSSDRIVVAGYSVGLGNFDMAIWRYNGDGTLDLGFAGTGVFSHHNAAGGGGADLCQDFAFDAAGNIVAVGYSRGAADDDLAIWRVDPTGALDTTFGGVGFVTHHDAAGGAGHDRGAAVTVDAAGRVIATGDSFNAAGDTDMAIWVYDDTGTPDATFGTAGIVTHHNAAGGNSHDFGRSIALDGTGQILVGGHGYGAGTNMDLVIWRYDPTGLIDGTFGAAGVAVHDGATAVGSFDYGISLTPAPNNRILITGYSFGANRDMVIWRYRQNGTIDNGFGAGGIVVHDNAAGGGQNDNGWDITLDPSDNILVTGWSLGTSANEEMVIWRYQPNGNIDTTFGTNGVVVHDGAAGGNGDDFGRGITTDSSGRILVCGSSTNALGNEDMVIWRYR